MYRKFCKYLDKDFRFLPQTQQVRDFKEELLGTLMDKDSELVQKGITDEDERFRLCIEVIEGYQGALKELRGNPKLVAAAKKGALASLVWMCYMLVVVGAFLAVSFIFKDVWAKSWLIIVDGMFLGLIGWLTVASIKFFKSGKIALSRALLVPAETLLATGAFLTVSVLLNLWHPMWLVFLALPVLIMAVDLLTALMGGKSKKGILVLSLAAFITVAAVMAYLILAILMVIPWHPFWLIILGGVALSAIIVTVYFATKRK